MPYQIRHLPWNELVSMAMEYPLHCQPGFIAAFAEVYQFNAGYLTAWDEDSLVSLMPIFEKKHFGLRSIVNPQLFYYHPIHFRMEAGINPNRAQMRKLDICKEYAEFIKRHFQKAYFNLSPAVQDVRGFTWSGLQASPLYTSLIPLKTIEPSAYFKNERNLLNKAVKDGVHIEEKQDFQEFFRLMKLTVRRQKMQFAISEAQHARLLENLFDLGCVRQFNALIDSVKVATFLILTDQTLDTVYAWQHYTDPEYFNSGVSPFFMDRLFQLLKDEYSTFDYCGANHPAISRYKAAMGAELQLFFRIQGNSLTWK